MMFLYKETSFFGVTQREFDSAQNLKAPENRVIIIIEREKKAGRYEYR